MGYCPQFDPLIERLTVREHLLLFARLRGIPRHEVQPAVEQLMELVGLYDFKDRSAVDLSGGNKRKLSLAMAIVGDPTLVLLDEPSTGMDPLAKRFMWNIISTLCQVRLQAV